MMLSSQSIPDIETPYRLLNDIEDTSTESNNSIPVVRRCSCKKKIEEETDTFYFVESTYAWYLFFGVWVLILIGCFVYIMVV